MPPRYDARRRIDLVDMKVTHLEGVHSRFQCRAESTKGVRQLRGPSLRIGFRASEILEIRRNRYESDFLPTRLRKSGSRRELARTSIQSTTAQVS